MNDVASRGEKNVVVTGANRGIGLAVARQLLGRGCRVVLVARDQARGEEARRELSGAGGGGVGLVVADLGSVRGAREAARAIREACPRIDVLIHNAALWPERLQRNEDGIESAFAVNHLAPFVLNLELEPALIEARARVVQVSAGLYVKGKPDLDRSPRGDDFHPIGCYATTKLYNLMLVPLFAERWRERVTINAVHPGVIRTGLGDRGGLFGYVLRAVKRLWKSPEQGAQPVVRLALDPALEGVTGRYFHLEDEMPLLPMASDAATAQRLWAQALSLSGVPPLSPPEALGAQATPR